MDMSNKINHIIGIVIVIALISFGFFWFVGFKINQTSPVATPVNKIENFSDGQLPSDFPKQIPIETGAQITSSYDATSPEGRVQASVVFQSSKSVAANFVLYKNYLAKNGWKTIAQSSTTNMKSITAQNKSGILNITIHQVADPNKSLIDLSFLVAK